MSWSLQTKVKRSDFDAMQAELMSLDRSMAGQSELSERDVQISLAMHEAAQIAASKVFENADELTVILSGHANPEFMDRQGWSGDAITVTVAITKYKV